MKGNFKWAFTALLFMPFFFSCATYNSAMDAYYSNVRSGNYDKAIKKLEGSKFMQRNRNRLLFCMEAGKMYRLKGDPVKSNQFFNEADDLMEAARKSGKDIVLGNLLNPMMESYRGEQFEIFMLHFYKALNYLDLQQPEEAVVEARRITLAADRLADQVKKKENRYHNDAFALNLQGMIYEQAGDMNNAFIAYRNAAEQYLQSNYQYYGVPMPAQLKQDLLRTAASMGFSSELSLYESKFGFNYTAANAPYGEAVIFVEQGRAPVKEEKNLVLSNAGAVGMYRFNDPYGYNNTLPFDYHTYGISESKISAVRILRVAMPVYQLSYHRSPATVIQFNGQSFGLQLAQNFNTLAVELLKERFLKELANAVARQLTKKLMEKGTEKAAENMARKKEKKSDKEDATAEEKEKKKKQNEERAQAAGEMAGMLMNIANTLTEKADTRNWQSLPAYISYIRVPLKEGENNISINAYGQTKQITIPGKPGLQMLSMVID